MKKILLLSTIILGSVLCKTANAQFHVSINIGAQPAWGPVGYDYAENYYLPDIEAYYCVPRHQFVYFDDGRWVYADQLPGRYGDYDLYNGYKVVINERDPWCHFNEHRQIYAAYRFRHDQRWIGQGQYYGGYRQPVYENRGWDRGRGWGGERHEREEHERGWERHEHDRDHGRDFERGRDRGHDRGNRGW